MLKECNASDSSCSLLNSEAVALPENLGAKCSLKQRVTKSKSERQILRVELGWCLLRLQAACFAYKEPVTTTGKRYLRTTRAQPDTRAQPGTIIALDAACKTRSHGLHTQQSNTGRESSK